VGGWGSGVRKTRKNDRDHNQKKEVRKRGAAFVLGERNCSGASHRSRGKPPRPGGRGGLSRSQLKKVGKRFATEGQAAQERICYIGGLLLIPGLVGNQTLRLTIPVRRGGGTKATEWERKNGGGPERGCSNQGEGQRNSHRLA